MFTQILPPFPTQAAPEIIRNAMVEAAQVTQAPDALIGSAFLAAVSLACQNSIDVQRLEGLVGPCSMLFLTYAVSGERKSAVDNLATKAFRDFDEEQAERANKDANKYKAQRATWDIELKVVSSSIEKAIKKGQDPSGLAQQLEEIYSRMPAQPAPRKILYDDTTPAGFKFELRHKFSSVGFFSAEAKAVESSGMMDQLSLQNKLWGGETIHITRRATESYDIIDARVTTSLMSQPGNHNKKLNRHGSEARIGGYFSRALVTHPASTVGSRIMILPISPSVRLSRFNSRITEILKQDLAAIEAGTHERKILKFSLEAQQRWQSVYNCVELSLGAGGYLFDINDFGSKFAENVARMAALFHRFEGFDGDEISLETLDRAGTICEWYLGEFKRLFSPPPPIPQEQLDASLLEAWLRSFAHTHQTLIIKKNVALQSGPNPLRNKSRLNAALQVLVWRYVVKVPKDGKSLVIVLNPEYFLGKGDNGQTLI